MLQHIENRSLHSVHSGSLILEQLYHNVWDGIYRAIQNLHLGEMHKSLSGIHCLCSVFLTCLKLVLAPSPKCFPHSNPEFDVYHIQMSNDMPNFELVSGLSYTSVLLIKYPFVHVMVRGKIGSRLLEEGNASMAPHATLYVSLLFSVTNIRGIIYCLASENTQTKQEWTPTKKMAVRWE